MNKITQNTLHEKPFFLFPNFLKRWSFQKYRTGIWSFLYYQERSYFFFPKIWSLDEKGKIIFLKKKKKRKYNVFFKCSEKMVFSEKIALEYDLFCNIWEDGISFSFLKIWCFLFRRNIKGDLSQKIHGNMIFSVYMYLCYKYDITLRQR